jgi:hypothetical protein
MTSTAILYPGVAMFFLTLGVILWLGFSRYAAIHNRSVSIKYYRTFNEGNQPERLHLLSRHVQNHFETPPLFYAGILFTYASGSVTLLSVVLAWLFFITRCVHSFIHLGANDVSSRFFTFGASLVFLAGIWGALLVSLLESSL